MKLWAWMRRFDRVVAEHLRQERFAPVHRVIDAKAFGALATLALTAGGLWARYALAGAVVPAVLSGVAAAILVAASVRLVPPHWRRPTATAPEAPAAGRRRVRRGRPSAPPDRPRRLQ